MVRLPHLITAEMRDVRRSIKGEERERDVRVHEDGAGEQEIRERDASIRDLYRYLHSLEEERQQAYREYNK